MAQNSNRITRITLQEQCGFSDPDFNTLWETAKRDLLKARNRVGLEGSSKNKSGYNIWLENYLDSGIGVEFWSSGAGKKWDLAADREDIRKFLRSLLTYMGGILRRMSQANRVHSESDDDEASSVESSAEEEDISPDPRMSAAGDNTGNSPANHIHDDAEFHTEGTGYHGFERSNWAPQYVDPRLSLPWPIEDPLGELEDEAHRRHLMMMATPLIDPTTYTPEEPLLFLYEYDHYC